MKRITTEYANAGKLLRLESPAVVLIYGLVIVRRKLL